MPGIVGIISKNNHSRNQEDLNLMIECMMHEAFYTSGTYTNDRLGLYAGWVCQKDSFSDCMPVFNEKKDLILLFSGENFIDNSILSSLRAKGHDVDKIDASYLIHLYEENADRFYLDLNGWFCGILIDLRKEHIVLFNDRYAMNRIYYHENENEFMFSSEAKSLLKVRPGLRNIDAKSLGQFFSCDCVLKNRSLFSNISLLPGSSTWKFNKSNFVEKEYYFKPEIWENQPILDKESFYRALNETFKTLLPRYFHSDKPIGMSLTSGLDTRMIMSCLDHSRCELPCFTFSGSTCDLLDAKIAGKIAEVCHQTHKVLPLEEDFLSNFSNYAEKTVFISDGCLDICASHDLYFNTLARQISPIRMTGKFGSEVLRDLTQFKANKLYNDIFSRDFSQNIQEAVEVLAETKTGHNLSFSVFSEMPLHEYGRLSVEMSKLTLRSPYMDNDFVKLMYKAPKDVRTSIEIPLQLIEDNNPDLRKIMTDRGTCGNSNYIIGKLTKLFYYLLFKSEYTYLFELPHLFTKIDSLLKPININKLLVGRYKFEHYRIWFRDRLSDYIQNVLLDDRTLNRPYYNRNMLESMVRGHISGNRNYRNEINKILTVELIHRLLIEEI